MAKNKVVLETHGACRAGRAGILVLCLILLDSGRLRADSFDMIPLPTGGISGSANAISADGSTVVGSYIDGNTSYLYGFSWRGSGNAAQLPFLGTPSGGTFATAVNADGSVIVGTSGSQGFRWTSVGGIQAIPFLAGGSYGTATGVSSDGTVVVGSSSADGYFNTIAYRWTQASGTQALGTLDTLHNTFAFSTANAISADGQVIVGQSSSNLLPIGEAFRWKANVMQGLGTLTGTVPYSYSFATAVNADGSVVVGQSSSATVVDIFGSSGEAFRWTASDGQMHGLGALSPTDMASKALAVSADGNVVVGFSQDSSFIFHAFRWTPSDGMKSVQDLLTGAGVSLAGWNLESANGVSADGKIIVGNGTDPDGEGQAWIARFSSSGTGLTTPQMVAQSYASLAPLTQGAAGRIDGDLSTQAFVAQNQTCTTCAYLYNTGGSVPGDPYGTASLGVKFSPAPDIAVAAAIGGETGKTNLDLSGKINSRGVLASAFAARLSQTGLQTIAALSAEVMNADIVRGYYNGNTLTSSRGSTNGVAVGGLVKMGWTFKASDALHLTPFASYSIARVRFGGFTESGGAFPSQFDAIAQTAQILRLGGEARYNWTPDSWAFAGLNWGHRFGETAPEIAGTLLGLFSLNVPGAPLDRDFVEMTGGLRVPLTEKAALSASVTMLASENGPATFLGRMAIGQAF